MKSVSHCRSKIPNPSLSYYLPLAPRGNGLGATTGNVEQAGSLEGLVFH